MINRINKNEERFDSISETIKKLNNSIDEFNNSKNNIRLLNKYYGSKSWLNDKDAYENNLIPKIKAGVLSEDGVWNMLEELDDLIVQMKSIIDWYEKSDLK